MAVNYPLANWIKPADSAGTFAKGYSLGTQSGHAQAQIAMERARLAQHANQQAVEITLRQQQAERQSMVEQQKLEVQKAYHQEQTQLKAQELEMKEQMMQEKIKEAAARQMAMDRFRQAIANNEDPARATLMHLAGQEGMGGPTSTSIREISERSKPSKDVSPEVQMLDIGGQKVAVIVNPNTGHFQLVPQKKESELTRAQAGKLLKDAQGLSADSFGGTNQFQAYQQGLADIAQGKKTGNTPAASNSPFKEGDWIRDKKSKQVIGQIVNGQLVPIQQPIEVQASEYAPIEELPPAGPEE